MNANPFTYSFYGKRIPLHLRGEISNYVIHRIPPSVFLQSVICNDLFQAVGMADTESIEGIDVVCAYFHNEAPSACYGSKENMDAWLEAKGDEAK